MRLVVNKVVVGACSFLFYLPLQVRLRARPPDDLSPVDVREVPQEIVPLVQSFMQKHPDVRLDLKLDEGLVDLVEHGIDVAVRIGPLADSALIARRVATSQRLLVAGKKYLAKLDGKQPWPRIPQDLMDHACLVYTGLLPRNQWEFRTADGSVVTVRVQGPLQSNNSEVLRAAILDGMGIGYLPDWLLSDLLASGDVLVLMSDWQVAPIPVHLVSPAERR